METKNRKVSPQKKPTRKPQKFQEYDYEAMHGHTIDLLDEAEARRLINEMRRPVYATKTVKAGTKMDVEVYPEYTRLPSEAQRTQRSREAQRNLNDANSRKACDRLINANFTEHDYWLTLSYNDLYLPDCIERAQKDVQNWIKRVNRRRTKEGCKSGNAKYIYVIEHGESKSKHRSVRCHIHVIMDGGLPMEEVLGLWTAGRTHGRCLAMGEDGLSGLAQYITKDSPTAKKRWCASKGLRRPIEHKNHRTFRRRRVEKLALSPGLMAAEMEKQYPSYWYVRGEVRWNGINGQFYLSAKMRLKGKPGDVVKLSGAADAVAQIPPAVARRLSTAELVVVSVNGEFVTVSSGRQTYTIPGRAVVVMQGKGGVNRASQKN